jgi:glycolate oxidase
MSWHCEDAAVPYSEIPALCEQWTAIVDRYASAYAVFDNWGILYGSNAAYKPWGEYLIEQDIGIREQALNDESWAAWVRLQGELAQVTLAHGGSMTACHGSTRDGMAQLVPLEVGDAAFRMMTDIKDLLDPNNIMNPGKNGIGTGAWGNDG